MQHDTQVDISRLRLAIAKHPRWYLEATAIDHRHIGGIGGRGDRGWRGGLAVLVICNMQFGLNCVCMRVTKCFFISNATSIRALGPDDRIGP